MFSFSACPSSASGETLDIGGSVISVQARISDKEVVHYIGGSAVPPPVQPSSMRRCSLIIGEPASSATTYTRHLSSPVPAPGRCCSVFSSTRIVSNEMSHNNHTNYAPILLFRLFINNFSGAACSTNLFQKAPFAVNGAYKKLHLLLYWICIVRDIFIHMLIDMVHDAN